jgi:hypothetical protein
MSSRDGTAHIFKQAIDQTQPELLVGGNERLFIPRLNPDATELLYLIMPDPGQGSQNVRIMRMPLAGGTPQMVLEAPWILNLQCARLPSRLCIYSRCEFNQKGFLAFDPVTGASSGLSDAKITSTGCDNWSLSPDGKYLATTRLGRKDAPEIHIVSIADGAERTIGVPHWTGIANIDWTADGKSVWVKVFSRDTMGFGEQGIQEMLTVDLIGKITDTLNSDSVRFRWAIPSPDGRRVALNGATINSNVWLLENF